MKLQVPVLSRFLGVIDLRTGVEVIVVFCILNKAAGFFGILALVTGAEVTSWQLSMYIYSIILSLFFAWGLQQVRRESAFNVVVLSYVHLFDFVINAGYTALFASTWFIKTRPDGSSADEDDSANRSVGGPEWMSELVPSLLGISVLWTLRAYFIIVIFSYARILVLRSNGLADIKLVGDDKSAGMGARWRAIAAQYLTATSFWRANPAPLDRFKRRSEESIGF